MSGSISIACKFSVTSTGYGPILTSKESDNECAGSVETNNVFLPFLANHKAVEHETLVFQLLLFHLQT